MPQSNAASPTIDTILDNVLSDNVTAGTLGTGSPRVASKTVTFTGASGLGQSATNTTWFTVTGLILVEFIAGRVTTNLTVSAGATITLGVTGSTSLFIAATAGSTLLTSAEIWASTTATAAGIAIPAALKAVAIDANILSAVAVNNITAGVIEMNLIWRPLTPGATVT